MGDSSGFYRNWKNGEIYEVTGESEFEEDHDTLVHYRSLTTNKEWSRRKEIFFGTIGRDGYVGPRFIKIETLTHTCPKCWAKTCHNIGIPSVLVFQCLRCNNTWSE